jgi:hypothetical protein
MTRITRRNNASAFKAKVALAAMKGEHAFAEVAEQRRRPFTAHISARPHLHKDLRTGYTRDIRRCGNS